MSTFPHVPNACRVQGPIRNSFTEVGHRLREMRDTLVRLIKPGVNTEKEIGDVEKHVLLWGGRTGFTSLLTARVNHDETQT